MRIAFVLLIALIVALPLVTAPPVVAAEPAIIVIVNPENPATSLDRKFVTAVFLKKRTRWGNDATIKPVDLGSGSTVRRQFSEGILGRSVSAVRRYWSQLVFSGRGVPPPELARETDVVAYVLSHAGAIGYVSEHADLKGAKVVQLR
jgi:ABC-type phosphate transport system substrate-binding protein